MTDAKLPAEPKDRPDTPRQTGLPEVTVAGAQQDIKSDFHRMAWMMIRGSWIILASVIVALFYSGYSMTKFQPVYRARMVVAETGGEAELRLPRALGALAAQFGGSGNAKGGVSPFEKLEVMIVSASLAERLDRKYGMVKQVYGGAWDAKNKTWRAPSGGFKVKADSFFRKYMPIPQWRPPTVQSLARYIAASVVITDSKNSSVIHEISFEHPDRAFALQFLSRVYREAEESLREQEIQLVSSQVEYVKSRLAVATLEDHRQSLISLLLFQEKRMMELEAGLPIAGEVLEPPIVSENPTRPNVIFNLVLAMIVGFVLGVILVIIVNFARQIFADRPARKKI